MTYIIMLEYFHNLYTGRRFEIYQIYCDGIVLL